MLSSLLLNGSVQGGIPSYVWIILGVIVGIVLIVLSIRSFWSSRIIATLLSILGIVLSIMTMTGSSKFFGLYDIIANFTETYMDMQVNTYLVGALLCGFVFTIMFVYALGSQCFDSKTEGVYLVGGSLLQDSNHPLSAFMGVLGTSAFGALLIFAASYAWTFVIGLIFFILFAVELVIEMIKAILN